MLDGGHGHGDGYSGGYGGGYGGVIGHNALDHDQPVNVSYSLDSFNHNDGPSDVHYGTTGLYADGHHYGDSHGYGGHGDYGAVY